MRPGQNAIPDRPEGDWSFHQDILAGNVKLPAKIQLPPKQPKRPELPECLLDGKQIGVIFDLPPKDVAKLADQIGTGCPGFVTILVHQ